MEAKPLLFPLTNRCRDGKIGEYAWKASRPEAPLTIGRPESDPEKVRHVYNRGRADAEKAITKLSAWLGQA